MTTASAVRPSMGAPINVGVLSIGARQDSGLFGRRASMGVGVACAALAAGALMTGSAAASSKVSETFSPTGVEQSFTVPAGVTSVRVRAVGAAGENAWDTGPFDSGAPGGAGAVVVGQLPVTPGEVLYLEVASNSFNGGAFPGEAGGFGGGASDVRAVPSSSEGSLESRLLVAAGGGEIGRAHV